MFHHVIWHFDYGFDMDIFLTFHKQCIFAWSSICWNMKNIVFTSVHNYWKILESVQFVKLVCKFSNYCVDIWENVEIGTLLLGELLFSSKVSLFFFKTSIPDYSCPKKLLGYHLFVQVCLRLFGSLMCFLSAEHIS